MQPEPFHSIKLLPATGSRGKRFSRNLSTFLLEPWINAVHLAKRNGLIDLYAIAPHRHDHLDRRWIFYFLNELYHELIENDPELVDELISQIDNIEDDDLKVNLFVMY